MHASYKMQIVPENGSLLNSRCTYSLAVLNHTGEALSQRQYKIMKEQALAAQLPRWPHRLLTTSAHFRTGGPRAGLRRRKWQEISSEFRAWKNWGGSCKACLLAEVSSSSFQALYLVKFHECDWHWPFPRTKRKETIQFKNCTITFFHYIFKQLF